MQSFTDMNISRLSAGMPEAQALIAIAHPKFREDLLDFASKVHYLERAPDLMMA